MKRIGILSDTHGFFDEKITRYFDDVDEIWHAGDIGDISVTNKLAQLKPLVAVYGNIDGTDLRATFPEYEIMNREGCKILLIHIAGAIGKYTTQTKNLILQHRPDILVCGHSHIVKVMKDEKYKLLYINPGAAGIHGFHKMKTILRFELENSRPQNMQLIELGKRGEINTNSV